MDPENSPYEFVYLYLCLVFGFVYSIRDVYCQMEARVANLISIDVPLVGVNKKFGTSLLSAPPILHQSPQKLVYLDHAPHS